MKYLSMRFCLISILLFIVVSVSAQYTPDEYIKKYNQMAVREMKRSGVPASITLSQGILESASGGSYLAKEGNNHFGIKCHIWEGEEIYADDDAKGECFRKYKSVEDSYKDHSDFLRQNSRYYFLFELEITDYKGWANGLKQAGYATSPTYAESLINLIEKYNLNDYDSGKAKPVDNNKPTKRPNRNNGQINDNFHINPYLYEVLTNNNVPYIIVSDTNVLLSKLSQELDLMNWQLAKYNDLDKNALLTKGEQIYIKPKRNKAEKQYKTHTIDSVETMRDISQKYAVKLKKLYKYNNLEEGTEPKPGTVLNLRRRNK